jgi:hypothetical protein
MSGSFVRNIVALPTTPVCSQRKPVRNDVRLGLQTRILHVGMLEPHTALREPVNVRRLDRGVAVTTDRIAQIVRDNE